MVLEINHPFRRLAVPEYGLLVLKRQSAIGAILFRASFTWHVQPSSEQKSRGILKLMLDFEILGNDLLRAQFSISPASQELVIVVPNLTPILGFPRFKCQIVIEVDQAFHQFGLAAIRLE